VRAGSGAGHEQRLLRTYERIVEHEDTAWGLGWGRVEAVELQLVLDNIDDDVAERIDGPTEGRLETDRHEAIRETIAEGTGVSLTRVELDRVVVGPQHLIAVEIVGAGAILLDLHRIAEAGDLVVTDDVPEAFDVDPIVARVPSSIAAIDAGPTKPPFQDVVANVEIP